MASSTMVSSSATNTMATMAAIALTAEMVSFRWVGGITAAGSVWNRSGPVHHPWLLPFTVNYRPRPPRLPWLDGLQGLEPGVAQHQPFHAYPLEIDLYPGMATLTLAVQHHALAKGLVAHAAAQAHGAGGARYRRYRRGGPCRGPGGADFLYQVARDFPQKPRRAGVVLLAVQPA